MQPIMKMAASRGPVVPDRFMRPPAWKDCRHYTRARLRGRVGGVRARGSYAQVGHVAVAAAARPAPRSRAAGGCWNRPIFSRAQLVDGVALTRRCLVRVLPPQLVHGRDHPELPQQPEGVVLEPLLRDPLVV